MGGMLFAAIVIYLWLLVASEQTMIAITGTVVIGVCVAATMHSRWALALIPAAVMVGLEIWRATACAPCATATEDTFVPSLPFHGRGALLGATLGTAVTWHRRRSML